MKKQPKPVLAWAWWDDSCNRYIVLHGDTLAAVRAICPIGCEIVRLHLVPVKPKRRAKR